MAGRVERVVDEPTDAVDFELRALALASLDRGEEAVRALEGTEDLTLPAVFTTVRRAVLAFLRRQPDAERSLAETVATHTDPEALMLYGLCQARLGAVESALRTVTAAVDGGYAVPEALAHPWIAPLRGPRLEALRERVAVEVALARRVFSASGGDALLGA
jgi:hypothetical protein